MEKDQKTQQDMTQKTWHRKPKTEQQEPHK